MQVNICICMYNFSFGFLRCYHFFLFHIFLHCFLLATAASRTRTQLHIERPTHTHIHSYTYTNQLKYTCIHTFYRILAHTHIHMHSTRTHTERARPAAVAFFRFVSSFAYTLLPYILFVFAVVCERKNKKKNRRIAVFFNRNFMRNMFAALLAQNFFSLSFFSTVFFITNQ